ncbi:MAG: MoaD/ThiS family protein [Deltaproteobacteria bacterium]|nr:MoaD/ThiS family protein [Deltaproteobacteria bacterium]
MRVIVEPTYEMGKALGADRFELEDVETVADVVAQAKRKVGPDFDRLAHTAAVVVNGVMINYRQGLRTRLADGDVVGFVMAAAGG